MDRALPHLAATIDDPTARLVRVMSLRGFGLRDAADGAVLTGTGDGVAVHGEVLAGLADATIRTASAERAVIRASITDRDADAGGLVCGGVAELLVSPLGDLPADARNALLDARAVALVARLDGGGTDHAVHPRSEPTTLPPDVHRAALDLLGRGATASAALDDEWVAHAVVPTTRLHVVGTGAMAEAITAQAELLGWSAGRADDVDTALDWLDDATAADALVILSHDRAVDVPTIAAALRSPLGYLGAMGSRGTQSARRSQLTGQGFTEADLARIHGPVGLDLGGRRPAETAVAIAAEVIAVRNGKRPGSLRDGSGSING